MSELGVNPDSNRIAQANAMQMVEGGSGRTLRVKAKNNYSLPQEAISALNVESDEIKFSAKFIKSSQASQNEVSVSKKILVKSDSIGSYEPVKKSNNQLKFEVNNLFHTVKNSKGEVSIKSANSDGKREVSYKDPSSMEINQITSSIKTSKYVYVGTIQGNNEIKFKKGKAKDNHDIILTPFGLVLKESQRNEHPDFDNYSVKHSTKLSEKEKDKINEMLQNDNVYAVSDEQFASFVEIHNTRIEMNQAKTEKSEKKGSDEVRSFDFHALPRQTTNGEKVKLKETEVFNKYYPLEKDLNKNKQAQNKRNVERHSDEAREAKMEVMRDAVQRQENSIEEKKEIVKNDYLQQDA